MQYSACAKNKLSQVQYEIFFEHFVVVQLQWTALNHNMVLIFPPHRKPQLENHRFDVV